VEVAKVKRHRLRKSVRKVEKYVFAQAKIFIIPYLGWDFDCLALLLYHIEAHQLESTGEQLQTENSSLCHLITD
jgi:hypothetical protein